MFREFKKKKKKNNVQIDPHSTTSIQSIDGSENRLVIKLVLPSFCISIDEA